MENLGHFHICLRSGLRWLTPLSPYGQRDCKISVFLTTSLRIAEIANEKSNCIIPPFPSGAFHPALNNKWLVQVKFWSEKLNLILSSEERGSEGEADVGGAAGEADIVNLAGLEGGFVRFPNPLITGTK